MGNGSSANGIAAGSEEAIMRFQMKREAAILTNDSTCAVAIENSVPERTAEELVDEIDQFLVKGKSSAEFYDPAFMQALSCSMRVGLTVDNQLSASRYVKDFFTDPKQIGGISVEGFAMMTGMKGNKGMFVIKAPRNPGKDSLIHEYFVAAGGTFTDSNGELKTIIGTNWLRKVCLNYSQILGAFRCGAPDIDPLSKRLRAFCSTENPASYVNYVIYEKIDGPDFAKAAATITATTFVTSMIQIAYALEIAQIYNGFTHYDLHSQNVILREANSDDPTEEVLVPYVMTEDLTVYVQSNYIPTIIDYGRCHIQSPAPAEEFAGAPTEHFGYHTSWGANYGISAVAARPYYDLYKILGFALYDMNAAQNPEFEMSWQIMKFFGFTERNQVVQWLNESRAGDLFSPSQPLQRLGFCLKAEMPEGDVCMLEETATMFNFLSFIEREYNDVWVTKVRGYPTEGIRVMECGADCTTFGESLKEMTEETNDIAPNHLAALGDFRNVMRYRNNLKERGLYFQEVYPQSTYGKKLLAEVDKINEELTAAFPTTADAYGDQIFQLGEKSKEDFSGIGYPIEFSDQAPTDPVVIAQELKSMSAYLDRMQKFASSYAEFKEFYEAGMDMTRTAGQNPSVDLKNYLEKEITPLFQAYDNSKGEIRRIVEATPVPKDYQSYKQEILVRTL